jgi:hypothetical protein
MVGYKVSGDNISIRFISISTSSPPSAEEKPAQSKMALQTP